MNEPEFIVKMLPNEHGTPVPTVVGQLVRCKDCISNNSYCHGVYSGIVYCAETKMTHGLEWFCGDGKPRDGEQQ